jgi:hypothetical protein
MTPQLSTKYVFTITALIGGVTSAGDIGHGVRRIIPVIGGEVHGEGINGKVCAFGADFQIIRPNELIGPKPNTPSRPTTARWSMSRTRAFVSARSSCCDG